MVMNEYYGDGLRSTVSSEENASPMDAVSAFVISFERAIAGVYRKHETGLELAENLWKASSHWKEAHRLHKSLGEKPKE